MIDPASLLNWRFDTIEQHYDVRDSVIYALGIGMGADPLDAGQLGFVIGEACPMAVPTMAVVLARSPSISADPRSGITRAMTLHGEQGLEIERPLPAAGAVRSQSRITEVVDKGAGKGAVVYQETVLSDPADGAVIARCWSSVFARADGGFGGTAQSSRTPHPIPDRPADLVCDLPTFPNAALLYRLNGDLNPLHSDPATASRAGFERPILHGLCTYGVAAHAILRTACGYDPARLRRFDVRFSSPVFPGETVSVEIWQDGADLSFRAHVRARGVKVIDNGHAVIASAR